MEEEAADILFVYVCVSFHYLVPYGVCRCALIHRGWCVSSVGVWTGSVSKLFMYSLNKLSSCSQRLG